MPRGTVPKRPADGGFKKPKKEAGGNVGADQSWLEAVIAEGEIHEPDESQRPESFIYDVQYQWDGLNEELNPAFFEEFRRFPNKPKCRGTSYVRDPRGGYIVDADWERIRRPCLRTPMTGADVCNTHGGGTPNSKQAAQRLIEEAAETVAQRLVRLTGVKDEVNGLIAHKDRITASNSVLDRAGVKGGSTLEISVPGYKKVLDRLFSDDSEDQ